MNDAPNLRRRIVGLERRMDEAWRLYVTSWLCLFGAAVLFLAGCVIGLAGWAVRAWW